VVIISKILRRIKNNQIKGIRWAEHVTQMWAERKAREN
jgi:hypothetical protein